MKRKSSGLMAVMFFGVLAYGSISDAASVKGKPGNDYIPPPAPAPVVKNTLPPISSSFSITTSPKEYRTGVGQSFTVLVFVNPIDSAPESISPESVTVETVLSDIPSLMELTGDSTLSGAGNPVYVNLIQREVLTHYEGIPEGTVRLTYSIQLSQALPVRSEPYIVKFQGSSVDSYGRRIVSDVPFPIYVVSEGFTPNP